MIELSKRLMRLVGWVNEGVRLVDIGSDHAYLPIYLVQQGITSFSIAGEVALGPYNHAVREVTSRGLEDEIDVRLGDGFEVVQLEDQLDMAVIAGMGGRLIASILEAGLDQKKVTEGMQLVLQPNNEEPFLRKSLLSSGFDIVDELIIEENGHYYEALKAVYLASRKAEAWSDKDLYFGRFVEKDNPMVFQEKWQREERKLDQILASLSQSKTDQQESQATFKRKKEMIEERLNG